MRIDESIRVAAWARAHLALLVSEPQRYSGFMVGATWEHVEGERRTRDCGRASRSTSRSA
ncbi:MAG: hypothetical protein U0R26_11210 [Solirubrobacterales bacterium]